jgi:hypothetical protein
MYILPGPLYFMVIRIISLVWYVHYSVTLLLALEYCSQTHFGPSFSFLFIFFTVLFCIPSSEHNRQPRDFYLLPEEKEGDASIINKEQESQLKYASRPKPPAGLYRQRGAAGRHPQRVWA